MAVNSFSSNDSLLHHNLHSGLHCFLIRPSSLIFTAYNITKRLLILPLCLLVLYLGLQRWRRHRSASAAATTSHSDSFTYHMVAMELIGVFGSTFYCWGIFDNRDDLSYVGISLLNVTWYGEMSFHILTCVERYLAVVHPLTYLSLRRERGIRIRYISIGCVWLISFGTIGLITLKYIFFIVDFCLLIVSLITISFCSLSVLCVLIRPGPGEQGGDRERVDQSKKRAFYTITAILVVLLFRCSGNLAWLVLILYEVNNCNLMICLFWLNIPNSLVLPLLFIHRDGTLACSKNIT